MNRSTRRRERLVRVVDQDVAGADRGEHVRRLVLVGRKEPRRDHRRPGAGLEVRPVQVGDLPTARSGRASRRSRSSRPRRGRGRASSRSRVVVGHRRSTSRRTASPNRRRRSSSSIASSRSSASSSSIARSALRVTRNRWCSRISMPGNSASRFASMICSSSTNRLRRPPRIRRGRTGGTLTRAKPRSPVSGSRSPTAIDSVSVADVRERMPGVDRERRQHREDLVEEALRAGARGVRGTSS